MQRRTIDMQGYYFEVERHGALTFAYIWREEDDAEAAPPVKSSKSNLHFCEADEKVSRQAAQWIRQHGVMVP